MAGGKAWGLTLAVLSSVCFGASGPFGKALIGAGLEPLQAVWVRVTGAALVLVPLVAVVRGRAALAGARVHWPALGAYGAVAVAACQGLYFVAASRLPVGVAILLEFTGPVLVLVWIRLVRRTRVPRAAAVGVGLAMIGLACVVEIWSGIGLDPIGLAAGLGAAACQAAYFLLVERMTGRVDPLVMTAAGMVVGSALLTVAAAPWALPWEVLAQRVAVGDHAAPGWTLAVWIVLVSTVLAYLTGVAAVQRLSAPVAGAICYIEAVAATVIAWAALGERLTVAQLLGGVTVLAGAFVAQRAAAAPRSPEPRAEGPDPVRAAAAARAAG
ncbi:EamA family transporter [Thermomonospora catenispora]|uniref:EamA family transporter n=1 Tax=Thermomonospora catenispora TaxID=2493090 RepID=UPI001F4FD9A0|nr:DMT family transporter [Thermomonospora catenispora]